MPETVVFVPVICVTHFSTRNNEKAAGWCTRVEQVEEGRAQRAKWDQIDHFGAFLQHRCETLVDDHFLAGIFVHVFETLCNRNKAVFGNELSQFCGNTRCKWLGTIGRMGNGDIKRREKS